VALTPGTRIGSYEIAAQIGIGGMGEVYRATDTKLGRPVAIKVLPAAVAQDAERLARFDREARTLASLNHPNIAAIYGLEDANSTKALVMELVGGPTLADRIAKGPIPADEALPIAKQIAEALEAAHAQGIVHRDLKPANVKVRADGAVKVLDFGMAKAMDPAGAIPPDLSEQPTITTPAMTQAGLVLGTAAYMSPEQAKGKPLDKRADVWAFGAVLYEMLTGRRAFGGESVAETLGAVIHAEPDYAVLARGVPTGLQLAIRRCLQKDPRRRWHDIADVRLVLDEDLEEESGTVPGSPSPAGWAAPSVRRVMVAAAIVGLAAGAALATFGFWSLGRPSSSAVPPGTLLEAPLAALQGSGASRSLDVARDGSFFVFAADGRVWIRHLDQRDATAIRGTESTNTRAEFGIQVPTLSPAGDFLAFVDDGAIKKVQVSGGEAESLATAPQLMQGMSWSDDGRLFYGLGPEGIKAVSISDGDPVQVIDVEPGEQAFGPQRLPGGDWVLFTLRPAGTLSWDEAHVVVESESTGERRLLLTGGHDGRYAGGYLVYGVAGALYAAPLNPRNPRQVVGRGTRLVADVRPPAAGGLQFAVSETGTLVYLPPSEAPISLVWLDRDGSEEPLETPASAAAPMVSQDGQLVIGGFGAPLWLGDLAGDDWTQLTRGEGASYKIFEPGGQSILFANGGDLYRRRTDGRGEADQVFDGAGIIQSIGPEDWSNDGALLVVTTVGPAAEATLDIGTIDTRAAEWDITPLVSTPEDESCADVSPDGRWFAYERRTSVSPYEVYVEPFPDGGRPRKMSSGEGGGRNPAWSPDMRELFYVTQAGALMAVPLTDTLEPGEPQRIGSRSYLVAGCARFHVLDDGNRFLMPRRVGQDAATVIMNWSEMLERVTAP
jgi:serine/threonine-protein kinase